MAGALSRQYFPTPTTNEWTNEQNIDNDDNATVCTVSGGGAIVYDFGVEKNLSIGCIAEIYTNSSLTSILSIQASYDGSNWFNVSAYYFASSSGGTWQTGNGGISFIGRTRYIKILFTAGFWTASATIRDMNLIF